MQIFPTKKLCVFSLFNRLGFNSNHGRKVAGKPLYAIQSAIKKITVFFFCNSSTNGRNQADQQQIATPCCLRWPRVIRGSLQDCPRWKQQWLGLMMWDFKMHISQDTIFICCGKLIMRHSRVSPSVIYCNCAKRPRVEIYMSLGKHVE